MKPINQNNRRRIMRLKTGVFTASMMLRKFNLWRQIKAGGFKGNLEIVQADNAEIFDRFEKGFRP